MERCYRKKKRERDGKNIFESVSKRPEPEILTEIDVENIEGLKLNIEKPTADEVRTAIQHLKNGKSPGLDNISAEILQHGGESVVAELTKIVTMVWSQEKVPEEWCKGIISALTK